MLWPISLGQAALVLTIVAGGTGHRKQRPAKSTTSGGDSNSRHCWLWPKGFHSFHSNDPLCIISRSPGRITRTAVFKITEPKEAIMVNLTWMDDAMGNHVGYAKHCMRCTLANKAEEKFCKQDYAKIISSHRNSRNIFMPSLVIHTIVRVTLGLLPYWA